MSTDPHVRGIKSIGNEEIACSGQIKTAEPVKQTARGRRRVLMDDDGYPIPEEELEYGYRKRGFPTTRRPVEYRRKLAPTEQQLQRATSLTSEFLGLIGDLVHTPEQKEMVIQLLATWEDLFKNEIHDMPATDLIQHRIPTYDNIRPVASRHGLFSPAEEDY